MVFEDGDVAVTRVIVPIEAGETIGGNEEGFDTVEWDVEGAVGVGGYFGGHFGGLLAVKSSRDIKLWKFDRERREKGVKTEIRRRLMKAIDLRTKIKTGKGTRGLIYIYIYIYSLG